MNHSSKIALVVLFSTIPTLANCATRNIYDDFGSVPLGSQITKLPIGSKIGSGCEKSGNIYKECDFISKEGLTYSIYEGEVVAVSYEFKGSSKQVLGLKSGDGLEAITSLERLYGIKFTKSIVDSSTVFSTNFSTSKTCLVACAVSITFDKNSHVKRIDKQPEAPPF